MDDYRQRIDRFIERLLTRPIGWGVVRGCSPAEIQQIEEAQKVKLPDSYVYFLERLGHGMWSDTEFFYPNLLHLKTDADRLLQLNGVQSLPENAFVFIMYHGFEFMYFVCDGIPDPPVYHYIECDPGATQIADSFSQWLSEI